MKKLMIARSLYSSSSAALKIFNFVIIQQFKIQSPITPDTCDLDIIFLFEILTEPWVTFTNAWTAELPVWPVCESLFLLAEWEDEEVAQEVTQQWEDDWDDDDVKDDFSLQLREELERNAEKN